MGKDRNLFYLLDDRVIIQNQVKLGDVPGLIWLDKFRDFGLRPTDYVFAYV